MFYQTTLTAPASRVNLNRRRGFTLIELIVVISIMAFLVLVGAPAFNLIGNSRDVSQSASDITSTLESARAYAMANNTYVFVGIAEVNSANAVTSPNQNAGIGRLVMVVVSSKDGSNNFDVSNQWLGDSNLTAISRPRIFNKIHMADFSGLTTNSGPMASRIQIVSTESLGSSQVGSQKLFSWPLASVNAQYNFEKVIQFDPRGTATLQDGTTSAGMSQWLEIGLQEAKGNVAPTLTNNDVSRGNIAAIQIDGVTGSVRMYRP
jgi:prepilin-type N-terminal cleavage/methylation domain-containing protein